MQAVTPAAALSIPNLLQTALAHHQAGRLPQAEAAYRDILEIDANHADALHYSGLIAFQRGDQQTAIELIGRALARNPDDAYAHCNMGNALLELKRHEDALCSYEQALRLQPDFILALYNRGNALLDLNRNEEALVCNEKVLQIKPDFVEAHINCGKALLELKRYEEALACNQRALFLRPNDVLVQINLGKAFQSLGRVDEAVACFREALRIQPESASAHNGLGTALQKLKLFEEAVTHYQMAQRISPNDAESFYNLGTLSQERWKLDEAMLHYRQALAIKPDYAGAHNNIGNVLREQEQLEDAAASYRRALAIKPDYAEAHSNLGVVLTELRQLDTAVASCRRALEIQPDFAEAHLNLGNALKDFGKFHDALASYRRAAAIKPDSAEAYSNLSIVQRELSQLDDAIASCRRALEIKPDYADAHLHLGNALKDFGQLDSAVASYRQVVAIKPDYATVYNNLGNAFQELGQLDLAVSHYRRAIELKPDFTEAHSNLLFCLNYHPDLPADAIFAEYRRWNERYARPLFDRRPHDNLRDAGRRLRIAYISPDLRRHSAGYFIGPLLTWHDKTQVEVFAYAEVAREDDYSARFRSEVDHWCNTVGMSDQALAERIRQDRIDILVDLAGHTAHNRLLVLARKPAPIQVSWMGYGYTTGLDAIDYFLADQEFAPPGCEALFSEKLVRLPVMTAYRPGDGMGEAGPLPARQGTGVRFGTLSRSVRINHHVIRVWAEILKRLPEASLIINSLNYQTAEMQARMQAQFAAHGVEAAQLEIGFESPPWNVLRRIDIGLDCFPHNSGTTLIESLYLGVPYVTLAGRPSVGRLGASFLRGVGHAEWIAHSEQEYVEHAVALASDLDRLAALRAGLRSQLEASALMDEAGFARAVEAAYRRMWQRWCRGEAPDHIEVK